MRMALVGRDGQPYHAVHCPACEVIYAYPQPNSLKHLPVPDDRQVSKGDSLADIYNEDYYESNWGDAGLSYRDESKIQLMTEESDRQREAIAALTGLPTGRLLDVGCGDGRYIVGFQRAGWEVHGIEVSPVAARWAREQFQVPVIQKPVEEVRLPDNYFDLIRLKHCIEHLTDPVDTMRRLFRALRPGGYAVIDTDNSFGLRSRLEITARGLLGPAAVWLVKRLMGKELTGRYGRLHPPIHLFTFNPPAMNRMLHNIGFEIRLSFSVAHGDPVWFPLVSRFRAHPVEVGFRLIDWLAWKGMDRGEAFVTFAQKP